MKDQADKKRTFASRCYALLSQVPAGKVTTYKELAHALGTKAYRAVGQAMHHNPNAPKVPCHRVVRSDGHLGGYAFGLPKKKALLKNEGIPLHGDTVAGLESYLYRF